jgi:antitoxin (DNA-binding transcriptional repressor) of toxin-antitoxin stability system
MNKTMLHRHLKLAKKRVAQGVQHIASQHKIVDKLVAARADTTIAKELLDTLELSQSQHLADRDRISAELAKS